MGDTSDRDNVGWVFDYSTINMCEQVSDAQAFETACYIAKEYGLLVGGSTG
ncbi:hypothetical protein [Candidatus Williamhamiltonella defendens]|uniref:hypothetical protein n=1 Tax=Candidatus Williamhamiltonella defendens TaxID=138072 RepID=UPI001F2F81B3|nr:hypothetical protein [Candidatus Hamiltonella defensa]